MAIDRALEKKSRVAQMEALDEIADKVVETALQGPSYQPGDPWFPAVMELANRLDGKPSQEVTGADGGPVQVEAILRKVVD